MYGTKRMVLKAVFAVVLLLVAWKLVYGSGTHEGGHHGKNRTQSHWVAPKEAVQLKNPIVADDNSIALGKQLYGQFCMGCHGKNAEGNGSAAGSLKKKPTDLKAMSGGHADGDFAWKIRNGKGEMPAWGDELESAEIWHLVNYIQSLASH
jgi:mono/diheme cytochrome c family protein